MEDIRDVLSDAELRRLTNPTDHAGRTAKQISIARQEGCDVGDILCPECSSPMEVRGGDGIALHLYHSRGNATRNCAGAQETAWHLFCKRAAKNAGWSTETTVRLPCGVRRADAYRDGEFLEFVHSQSPTYITKHQQLAENGIKCRWIIDSAASFHSKLRSETFDFGDGFRGPLRVKGLFKPKMADLVDGLGHANCLVYYRWAVWQCVGRDEWEVLPQLHDLQQWCTCDGGFNNEIIIGHQRSSEHGYRVEVRPVDFRTNWRTQVEYLFEEVLGARHRLALEALAVAAESAAKASRSSASANEHGPGEPICRKPQSSRYLTLDQVKAISESVAIGSSQGTVNPDRIVRTTTRWSGRPAVTSETFTAFIKDSFWAKGFEYLQVVLIANGSELVDRIFLDNSRTLHQFCAAIGITSIEIRVNPRSAVASRLRVTTEKTGNVGRVVSYAAR
jgi:hypothetical protein